MGHLANGDLCMEGSGKRFLENGGGVGLDIPKFKKRRVSAIRDFPPGCGRFAAPVDGKLKGEVENLGVESNSVEKLETQVEDAGVESNSVREKESLAEVKTSDVDESPQVLESARCETTSPLEIMEGDTLPPELPVETIQDEALSADNVPKESEEKKFPPRRKTSATRDSVQGEAEKSTNGLEAMSVDILTPKLSVEPVQAEKPVEEEVLNDDQSTSGVSVNVEVKSMMNKFPPRRKTSATRDFPPGCGRGAAPVNLKEVQKSVDQGVKADAKQLEKRVQPGAASESKMKEKKDVVAGVQVKPVVAVSKGTGKQVSARDKVKQVQTEKTGIKPPTNADKGSGNSVVKQVETEKVGIKPPTKIDKGSGNSGVNLATESARLSKDTSFKNNSSGKSTNEPDPVSLLSYDDREIVQCLMAKPNCPWGQGKKALKPASVSQSPVERKKFSKTPSSIQLEDDQGEKASKSPSDNQSSRVEDTGLESLDDRGIVQSLMAARNCPWRSGKKAFKSPGGLAKKFVSHQDREREHF